MARKAKRRPPKRPVRPLQPGAVAPLQPGQVPIGQVRTQTPGRVGGDQSLVRSVEMSLPARAATRRGGRIVLDNTDPAIPLDRVPYFVSDLRHLGIVAVLMVVLLVAGAQLIPLLVR